MKLGTTSALGAAVALAGFLALRRDPEISAPPPKQQPQQEEHHHHDDEGADNDELQTLPPGHPPTTESESTLPSGHPSLDSKLPPGHPQTAESVPSPSSIAGATLSWTPPPRWKHAPNPNAMRIATFTIPNKKGDAVSELSIARAGGTAEANESRWIGQFTNAETKRSERTLAGFPTRVVEVYGTFGGMSASDAKANWGMLGAIVETPEAAHFFKLTGPKNGILEAREEFEIFLKSLKLAKL
jgi:hypothetical protein